MKYIVVKESRLVNLSTLPAHEQPPPLYYRSCCQTSGETNERRRSAERVDSLDFNNLRRQFSLASRNPSLTIPSRPAESRSSRGRDEPAATEKYVDVDIAHPILRSSY